MDAPMVVKSLKHLWEIWDIRALMLLSLFLQTFLILFAPLRRTSTNWTVIPLWSAYLLADWTATFAVGLISNSQNKKSNSNLLALWAPILLVHLGGPDTITAFSLEDNELWIRHLLSLVTQTAAAVYVFSQSCGPNNNNNNNLWAPTLLMFVSGVIKCSERVISLHSASLNSFRESVLGDPDPGPTYAKLINEYHSKKASNVPTRIVRVPKPPPSSASKDLFKEEEEALAPAEVVLYAHHFFRIFKGIFVDLIFTQRDRNRSRYFFNNRTAEDAFNVVAVELNLAYDLLFTKAGVVYCTTLGFYFRSASFACFVAALGLFYCDDKADFHRSDVAITYALLLGAIFLDVVSFLFILRSDWLMIATNKLPDDVNINMKKAPKSSFRKRWCESVSAFNLIHYCRNSNSSSEMKKEVFDWLWFVDHKPFTEALRDHVFKELREKSEMAEDLEVAKEISAAKGEWALRFGEGTELLPYFRDVDYDKSLLLLHIATELCYYDEKDDNVKKNNVQYRDFSKLLSDYMMYLLVMQPAMMSPVAGISQLRFRNTCAEAISYLQEEGIILSEDVNKTKLNNNKKPKGSFQLLVYAVYSFFKYLMLLPLRCVVMYPLAKKPESSKEHIKACNKILGVDTSKLHQVHIKGDRSKSVLFDGCILAKRLKELESLNSVDCKWKLMSKVWVEMLSYAAIHCRPMSHVQELSRGGELITIVWLLMVHFGLGNQYKITEDHARAKIIFDK